jgi:hypothetical protein
MCERSEHRKTAETLGGLKCCFFFAGLKPPVPLCFGLHVVMAKSKQCSMQDSTGD